MSDNDPLKNVQEFAIALNGRISDLLVRVEALRRALSPLGLSQEMFDEQFFAVQKEFHEYRDRELPKAVAQAHDEQIRKLLEATKGPKH